MSTIPKDIPYDIWRVASAVHENAKQPGPAVNSFTIDERTLAVEVSLLLMAERAAAEQRGAEREREAEPTDEMVKHAAEAAIAELQVISKEVQLPFSYVDTISVGNYRVMRAALRAAAAIRGRKA
jgi:uncharacterized protein YkuJ